MMEDLDRSYSCRTRPSALHREAAGSCLSQAESRSLRAGVFLIWDKIERSRTVLQMLPKTRLRFAGRQPRPVKPGRNEYESQRLPDVGQRFLGRAYRCRRRCGCASQENIHTLARARP